MKVILEGDLVPDNDVQLKARSKGMDKKGPSKLTRDMAPSGNLARDHKLYTDFFKK